MDLEDGLAERGRDIYEALIKGRDVSAPQKAMALNVARMADTLDRIEIELTINPSLTVENGQGTISVNPLITEARMITGALSTILAKMGISELPEPSSGEKSVFDQLAAKRADRLAARGGADPKDLGSSGG